ncbi:hypothetical protein NQ317_006067 [Molorchus minor]|uniref:Cyclin-dependent kinase inhibitor domain-containing protein n=1 Tax=Molorchus minor TaxID=1323400 RepID=A0ABQ9K513_9CUCU|nr:hypothetical protein NQ317_006067 [Molorchus minor]
MSTSVIFKPLGLTQETMFTCRPEVRKVKRVLFEPIDHAATQKFVEDELEKISVFASEKWNFDFKRERTLNPAGVYKWRPVTPQKTIRPIKIRSFVEDIDNLYAEPVEIVRPTPVRAIVDVDEEMQSPPEDAQSPKRKPKTSTPYHCCVTPLDRCWVGRYLCFWPAKCRSFELCLVQLFVILPSCRTDAKQSGGIKADGVPYTNTPLYGGAERLTYDR